MASRCYQPGGWYLSREDLHRIPPTTMRSGATPMSASDPLLTSLSDWSRMPLAAWPRSAALKVRQVGRGRIWILLDRLQVFLDHLQHRPRRPAEQRANLQVLMGIHFDVVDLWIPGHGRARRKDAGLALGTDAGRLHVGEIHAPLLPSCRHQVRADESQQTVAVTGRALAEQHVGLIHAVNRPVGGWLAADDAGEGRKKIHGREHRIRAGARPDLAGPADEAEGPDRAFGSFAQFAPEGTGITLVRRALVTHLAGGLALRSVVRGKDNQRVVVNAKFLQRVENLADVVIALHQLVAVLANPRLAGELLRRKVREMSH